MVRKFHPEKLGDFLLVEPKRLGFVEHLDPDSPLLGLVQNEFSFVGSRRRRSYGPSYTVLELVTPFEMQTISR